MISFLQKIKEKKAFCLLTVAIFLIIAGYVCTICFGSKTTVHLRKENAFVSNNDLNFKLKVDSCIFAPFSIGNRPSNILCYIHLQDHHLENHTFQVSLNEMGRFGHYKFFLKGYDKDLQGCTLLVTHDPIGTGLVYAGYILLALFIIFSLLSKDFIFRKLLKKLSLFFIFIILSENSFAAVPLSKEESAAFGQLSIAYNGRIAPFDSYARDYCKALNLTSATQLLLDPQAATRTVLNIYLYPEDYPNLPRPQMRIFPQGQHWLTPEDYCCNGEDRLFVAKILLLLRKEEYTINNLQFTINNRRTSEHRGQACLDYVERGGENRVERGNCNLEVIKGIGKFQQLRCAEGSIDIHRQRAEILYNRSCYPTLTIFTIFISSILYSIIYIIHKRRKKERKQQKGLRLALLIIPLFFLLTDFITRFYITRHLPLHNTYDTLICMSIFALIAGIISQKRLVLLTFISLLTACITALMAQVMGGQSFSAVSTSLVSPWLGVHVSVVMLSYTLFFIGFVISIISIFSIINKKNKIDLQRLNILNQLFNILGICFLAIGIMLGSVWANCSWGSYWSWDPKETMALLTLLAYASALVSLRTRIANRPLAYPILNILAFAFLLCTYFGVSAWFGGLHANY